MLSELPESEATGRIADIFGEIRTLWGVPYVSAIHRHMATRPGLLEWSWDAVAPLFRNGTGQDTGWRAAADLALTPLDPISRDVLEVWGLDAKAQATVANVCAGFVRVAPVNMVFAGLVRGILTGAVPTSRIPTRAPASWSAPPSLPATPPMADLAKLDLAHRAVVAQLATITDGKSFVPGLYRMLAPWPGFIAHVATVLQPRLARPEMAAAGDTLRARIDAVVAQLRPQLAADPAPQSAPAGQERADFLRVIETYRKTSPEMVIAGRLIGGALPKA